MLSKPKFFATLFLIFCLSTSSSANIFYRTLPFARNRQHLQMVASTLGDNNELRMLRRLEQDALPAAQEQSREDNIEIPSGKQHLKIADIVEEIKAKEELAQMEPNTNRRLETFDPAEPMSVVKDSYFAPTADDNTHQSSSESISAAIMNAPTDQSEILVQQRANNRPIVAVASDDGNVFVLKPSESLKSRSSLEPHMIALRPDYAFRNIAKLFRSFLRSRKSLSN